MYPSALSEPIAISSIAGRYLLFDIDVVTHLRRTYHICGVLTGTIPQIPQQNLFLGLPVELLPEEAKVLVDKKIAYIVEDTPWHKQHFASLEGSDRKKYLESLKTEALKAKRAADTEARKRTENALAKKALKGGSELLPGTPRKSNEPKDSISNEPDSLFDDERPASRASSATSPSTKLWGITPTVSYNSSSSFQNFPSSLAPSVPSSYPLFAHLHSRDYFMTPGLRFGCDYTVYPGDPLRFHSHFIATGYGWNEEIRLLDIVGGGRLGTGVKKGFLIGGENPQKKSDEEENDGVRTFCIEWGGM
ncbi:246d4efd-25e9-410d-aff9-12b1b44b95ff [Sclerotinia trifoliorum]|uniref:tRNA-splicing endonuclease subunit Sen34 n=1 Tax=Sclerotinia trifoliorum TaxID=28548 RepID=A0A8H2W322_9HELO|nr:246d4efd-25e9-410d-aff9-12b1b44b95ff [Sclerotinia trifoliorum]